MHQFLEYFSRRKPVYSTSVADNGNVGAVTSLECCVESRDVVVMTTGLCRVTSRLMTSPVTWLAADGDVGVAAAVTNVNFNTSLSCKPTMVIKMLYCRQSRDMYARRCCICIALTSIEQLTTHRQLKRQNPAITCLQN